MNHSRTRLVPILVAVLVSMLAWQSRSAPVASAASAAADYYCIIGTPASSWGITPYAAPQPNLKCFTSEVAAERSVDPYYFCVTNDADGWHITAYLAPQPGQQCYLTGEQAIASLPPSILSIGNGNPTSCSMTTPMNPPPGVVHFVKCTNGIVAYGFGLPVGGKYLPKTLLAQIGPRLRVRLMPSRLCHLAARAHRGACAGIHSTRWQRG